MFHTKDPALLSRWMLIHGEKRDPHISDARNPRLWLSCSGLANIEIQRDNRWFKRTKGRLLLCLQCLQNCHRITRRRGASYIVNFARRLGYSITRTRQAFFSFFHNFAIRYSVGCSFFNHELFFHWCACHISHSILSAYHMLLENVGILSELSHPKETHRRLPPSRIYFLVQTLIYFLVQTLCTWTCYRKMVVAARLINLFKNDFVWLLVRAQY